MEIAHNPIATSIIDEMFNFVFPKNYKPEKRGKNGKKTGKKQAIKTNVEYAIIRDEFECECRIPTVVLV